MSVLDISLESLVTIGFVLVLFALYFMLRFLAEANWNLRIIVSHLEHTESIARRVDGIRSWQHDIVTEIQRLGARMDVEGQRERDGDG